MPISNEVKTALYLDEWDYESGSKRQLRRLARSILTTEYTQDMEGSIFCPECCVGLYRSPREDEFDSAGRRAFFGHSRLHTPLCSLRVQRREGRVFQTEELARQAIEDENLVVINSFMTSRPELRNDEERVYDGDHVEDIAGQLTEVAIARHNGESFSLPSRVTTIRGICRRFDINFYKYYRFPGQDNAIQLRHALIDISTVTQISETPKLYYGVITNSYNCGTTPQNIRQTMFEFTRTSEYVDICLKVTDAQSAEHGITDDSVGRTVIMYGTLEESGIGLCLRSLGWGEFAILPPRYESLLD